MSGRQAEAARNDQRILEAARAVSLADPGAPVSAVAERAGVGIGGLYRRYRSKEDLLRGSPPTASPATSPSSRRRWPTRATRGRRSPGSCAAASTPGTSSITRRLAGRFTPTGR